MSATSNYLSQQGGAKPPFFLSLTEYKMSELPVAPPKQHIRNRNLEEDFEVDVNAVLTELSEMLIAKNRKYGDAALNPKQTFSKSSAIELINVRLDDKLSRIANAQTDEDEDPEWDLLGYLVLKRIALERYNK